MSLHRALSPLVFGFALLHFPACSPVPASPLETTTSGAPASSVEATTSGAPASWGAPTSARATDHSLAPASSLVGSARSPSSMLIPGPSDAAREEIDAPLATASTPMVFPPGFLFGTAIAGFQADMGCPTVAPAQCVDANSDWYQFVTSPQTVDSWYTWLNGEDPAVVGPGNWELYQADIDRASNELHNNGFRFSLEWSRIFPTATDGIEGYDELRSIANPDALNHYHAVLAALKARGMTPLVTLNHYTLPLWIHDGVACHEHLELCRNKGWLDKDRMLRELSTFAAFAGREFGGEVDLWATLNEPLAIVVPGFLVPSPSRSNPPAVYLHSHAALKVFNGLVEAHARMYDAVKSADLIDADGDGQASRVGLVYNMAPTRPADPTNPLDVEAADNTFYLYNMAFLNAVALGMFDDDLDGVAEYRADLANRMDYLGINYYSRIVVAGLPFSWLPGFSPLMTFNPASLKAEEYAQGIHDMIRVVNDDLDLESIITETGTAVDQDESVGSSFLVRHLEWTHQAMDEGARVGGFFVWTLIDNFEWNHGMDMKFGLYAVDPGDPQKVRVAREAAGVYGGIAETGTISTTLQAMWPM